jgi:hypothetical protein
MRRKKGVSNNHAERRETSDCILFQMLIVICVKICDREGVECRYDMKSSVLDDERNSRIDEV